MLRRGSRRGAAWRTIPRRGQTRGTMSREQLLRPRRLVGGYEYRLDEPDFETADLILGTEDVPNTPESLGTESAFARPKYIIGPDDRRRVDNPRFFPGSANAHLATQNCMATMIGPSTALCAAHCFFNDGWIPSRSITFGADTNAPTAPFGSFLADSLTLPGAWNHPATGLGFRSSGVQPVKAPPRRPNWLVRNRRELQRLENLYRLSNRQTRSVAMDQGRNIHRFGRRALSAQP
jgi:hypothetical protein